MQRTPDFEPLAETFERYRRGSRRASMLLGRACGRLAGSPNMVELARQALPILRPDSQVAREWNVDPSRLAEWRRAFQSAFPSVTSLQDLLTSSYGLQDSEAKWAKGTVSDNVDELFKWALSTNKLGALVSAAVAYNPGNAALRTLAAGESHANRPDDRVLLDEFSSALRDLSTLERYGLLQAIYRRIPVPAFYSDLARIIKAGYVRQLFTTNIDSLLEQALESIGLVRDVDFDVIVLGTEYAREALDDLRDRESDNRLVIIKLHGDISKGEFGVSQGELDDAVNAAKRFIKGELESDLVMLGYEGESPPLNQWLARSNTDCWWVSPEPPPGVMSGIRMRVLPMEVPDFLSALAARLVTLRTSPPGLGTSRGPAARSASAAPPPAAPLAPPPSERETLRQEIDRMKNELAATSLATAGTSSAVQRQEQVADRLRRLRELEDQLRALPDARSELLDLLDRLERSVRETDGAPAVDPSTANYLVAQLDLVRAQYQQPQLNAHIVSATLGAAMVVAERLGPGIIDPQDLRALAAFSPSSVVRA